jgi:pyrroloquinoline quinone biosynthesis protein E
MTQGPPIGLLAELTHRCPLQCPYCSNPTELAKAAGELDTATWLRVFHEAASIGVLQAHLSGGEPCARKDIVELVAGARDAGLYTNLITSAVTLDEARIASLYDAGLDHVQISFQGSEAALADRVGAYPGGHERKLRVARQVVAAGLPLTVNAVVHRQNLDSLEDIIAMALELGAGRLEVAHVQYYGWALANRAALMPSRAQLDRATEIVNAARLRLKGRMAIDYVVPDYYASRPKACVGGWGTQFMVVDPTGRVLPCHAAPTIEGMAFDTVRETSLADIWRGSDAFNRFRGTDWMPPLCRSCEFKEVDWGGCRCQAFALAGDAAETDPACHKSPLHAEMVETAERESSRPAPGFVYRRIGGLERVG